uniref:Uncharacterized protein n=1 Tax=Panagrolaimus sp. JU765 TaxID=591449 RepID=A0AC34R414_9BILA
MKRKDIWEVRKTPALVQTTISNHRRIVGISDHNSPTIMNLPARDCRSKARQGPRDSSRTEKGRTSVQISNGKTRHRQVGRRQV